VAFPADIKHRVRAARAYGDLSLDNMAEAAEIGRSTLIRIETGRRLPKRGELREIAIATGLPYEFFTADLSRLPELAPEADPVDPASLRNRRDRIAQEDRPAAGQEDEPQHGSG